MIVARGNRVGWGNIRETRYNKRASGIGTKEERKLGGGKRYIYRGQLSPPCVGPGNVVVGRDDE